MKYVLVLLLVVSLTQSAKILGVFPVCGKSHYILGSSLAWALAEHGHDVTVISCFGEETPPKNGTYRDIVITEAKRIMEEERDRVKFNMFNLVDLNPFAKIGFINFMLPKLMSLVFEDPSVQNLIQSNQTFDVIITEQFLNDAYKALATHFGAQLILLNSVGANAWVNLIVGNPSPPSYIPDTNLDLTHPLTFCDRLLNSIIYVVQNLIYNLYVLPHQDRVVKSFISPQLSVYDNVYNASIVLMNSHPSINQPVPYVPNMVDIGGFHIKPPKQLPSDFQTFLDDAKDGVIYFSMGSNLKSADLPVEQRDAILKTFAKLKQKVLWKWEDDVLPGQPPNVKLGKWMPQQDILAHPNVKLFITHGGLLSTTETIYHGVPVLAIPIFADQHMNARVAAASGYGLVVQYKEITEEVLTRTINELLNNPKYRDNAQYRSRLYHDRPVGPMDTAIYWVDYVIRHRGAPHLRVGGLDLPWYKYHLLDVIAFVALVVLVVLFVSYKLVKIVCRKYCSKKNKKVKAQ